MGKDYLGDGVYIQQQHGEVVLTTENGFGPSNTIVLDQDVLRKFINYIKTRTEYAALCGLDTIK